MKIEYKILHGRPSEVEGELNKLQSKFQNIEIEGVTSSPTSVAVVISYAS